MGKVKNWLMQMQEDAEHMPRDAWVYLHGESNVDIWYDIQHQQAMEQVELEHGS